jgi:hypothetical protein
MAALFKYVVGIAVIVPVVIILYAADMGEMFVGLVAAAQTPTTGTSKWNIERQKVESDAPYVAHRSLSPIYPATPGKELLGKPVYTARLAKKHKEPGSAKRIDVRQALKLYKVPRQIYSADLDDKNYPQQSLSYAEAPRSQPFQPRVPISFGHGIY